MTNLSMSWVVQHVSSLACGVQVWSSEAVVETYRADGPGAVKDRREAWIDRPGG